MAFHWRDGWFFERKPDGSVRIYQESQLHAPNLSLDKTKTITADITIPASEWCSIIASVSERGETAETFEGAKMYHGV